MRIYTEIASSCLFVQLIFHSLHYGPHEALNVIKDITIMISEVLENNNASHN